VALAVAATTVLMGGRPASAQVTFQSAPRSAFSYTDSRANDTNFTNSDPAFDVPVGAWIDDAGLKHKSRLFATFDLAGFAGKHIVSTTLRVRDDKTTDCAVRSLEVWETEVPASPPTWRLPPAHVGLLGTIGATPCPGVVGIDVSDRVRAAIAAGQQHLAVEIRVADAAEPGEGDPIAGRRLSWFAGVQLTVGYNTPPVVDTAHLYNNFRACETDAPGPTLGGDSVRIGAVFNDVDPNPGTLTGEFAIWPADDPEQRTTVTRTVTGRGLFSEITVPAGVIVDGGAYAWQVRVSDGTDTSPWSQTCRFTFDGNRPATAPIVTSENYPADTFPPPPGGTAPTFTFSPNGVTDVAAYQYSFDILGVPVVEIGPNGIPLWTDPFDQEQFVRAGPDGSVTVTIPFEPPTFVFNLNVRSFDHGYNASPVTTYRFFVAPTPPVVEPVGEFGPDRPVQVKLTPHSSVTAASEVVEYTVWVNDEEAQTVPAEPDGTATATVVLPGYGTHVVNARSHSANGFLSIPGSWFVSLANDPVVTSEDYPEGLTAGGIGIPGEFTFHPGPFGAASYVYSLNGEESTVAAGPDGTATVVLTPTTGGFQILTVRAVDAAGRESADTFYFFDVAVPTVTVASEVYPENQFGGGVGVEGAFTVQGPPGTAGFVYSFDFGPETTVEATADGSGSFTYVPDATDFHLLIVYAVDSVGTPITEPYFYNFWVA
jgi:hypothetical protein